MTTETSIKSEIKRNLLGALEVALFMPVARKRFGESKEEALRSFLIPILLLPLTIFAVYLYPKPEMASDSALVISILYSLRMLVIWAFFFGTVYMIAREVDRKAYFYNFVIATNWITIPATAIFLSG